MLSAIRSKSANFIFKALLVMVVLSFSFWGMGDLLRKGGKEAPAATVGNETISRAQLASALRQSEEHYRQVLGANYSPELLKALGIEAHVLGRLINARLMAQETARTGIRPSQEVVLEQVARDGAFADESGKFSKTHFHALLQANGLSEKTYLAQRAQDLASSMLIAGVTPIAMAPEALTQEIAKARGERRELEFIALGRAEAKEAPTPSDADLLAYFDVHKDRFAAPEYRTLSYIALTQAAAAREVTVSAEELRKEYEARIDDYKTEETREISQLLFDSEQEAKEAAAKLKAGEAFEQLASSLEQKENTLGNVSATELPAGADAVFALAKGNVSEPVASDFGWHIFKVAEIHPASTTPFEAVKDALEKELLASRREDAIYRAASAVEDQIAAGAALEEIAKSQGASVAALGQVDREGKGPDGKPVANLPKEPAFLAAAFETGAESISQSVPGEEGRQYFVRVSAVSPARPRALDEVRASVIQAWRKQAAQDRLRTRAQEAAARVAEGEAMAKAAASLNAKPHTQILKAAGAEEEEQALPAAAVKAAFALKEGGVTPVFPTREGGFAFARVGRILPATYDPASEDAQQVESELSESYAAEVMEQYLNHLKTRYLVEVTEDAAQETQEEGGESGGAPKAPKPKS